MKKLFRAVLFLALVMLFCQETRIFAYASIESLEQKGKVKVGYVLYDSYQEGEEGEPKRGYGYEYLQKIASYTGWEYEYVYGNFSELLNQLIDGTIDIMGNISRTPERTELLDFGRYPQGQEEYLLITSSEDSTISRRDLSSIEGKTIGVTKGTIQITLLKDWLSENGFSKVKLMEFDSAEERLAALDSFQIDATVIPDTSHKEQWKKVTAVGSSNFYFATNKNKPWLKKQLDDAQGQILDNEPDYNEEVMLRYVNYILEEKQLSDEEKSWAQEKSKIRVGFLDHIDPFCYINSEGEVQGLYRDIFDELDRIYELESVFIDYNDYPSLMEDFNNGKVDVIVPMIDDPWIAQTNQALLCSRITSIDIIQVSRKDRMFQPKMVAVNQNSAIQPYFVRLNYPEAQIVFTDGLLESIDAVREGKADCTYFTGDLFYGQLENELNLSSLNVINTRTPVGISLGVRKDERTLLAILNKLIASISPADITQRIIYHAKNEFHTDSFRTFIQRNRWQIMLLGISVEVILFVLILFLILLKQKNKKLKRYLYQSTHDSLTGLYNRYYLDTSIDELRGKVAENGIGFLLIDIDHFKEVNDTRGHETGDIILKELAKIISDRFRDAKMVCRWGGEEFLIVLKNASETYDRAEALRKTVENHLFETLEEPLKVTISIGCSVTPNNEIPKLSDLFTKADERLYEAKNGGRNCVKI